MDGEIVPGDYDAMMKFLLGVIQRYGVEVGKIKTVVSLDSPGGSIIEAEKMADLIFESHQATAVIAGHKCVSACFLLFAAGNPRSVASDAFVGVHSVSEQQSETMRSAAMTVIMSRNLAKRGLPPDIIGRPVQTPPYQVYRLTIADLLAMKVQIMGSRVAAIPRSPTMPAYQPPPLRSTSHRLWFCRSRGIGQAAGT